MDNFNKLLINVIGDVMVSAGVVAYLGSFTVSNNLFYLPIKEIYTIRTVTVNI